MIAIFFHHDYDLHNGGAFEAVIEIFHEADCVFYLRIAIESLVAEGGHFLLGCRMGHAFHHQIQRFDLIGLGLVAGGGGSGVGGCGLFGTDVEGRRVRYGNGGVDGELVEGESWVLEEVAEGSRGALEELREKVEVSYYLHLICD